jgi:hypothetical protein
MSAIAMKRTGNCWLRLNCDTSDQLVPSPTLPGMLGNTNEGVKERQVENVPVEIFLVGL